MMIASLLAALGLGAIGWQRGSQALDDTLADRYTMAEHVLSSEIARLRHLPRVIAEDPRLVAILRNPTPEARTVADAYLKRLRRASEAEEVYLIGQDGVTVASSNWDEPGSFIGAHYGFRPYFIQALLHGEGQYYAVGVTTGRPGVFMSARTKGGEGVVVVKVSLDLLEQAWARAGEVIAVADADGLIFLSALAHWRFRPQEALSPEVLARLGAERRYTMPELGPPLPIEDDHLFEASHGKLRLHSGTVRGTDWRLIAALPVAPAREQAWMIGVVVAGAGLLASVFAVTLWQRRQILRLRLEEADRLEARVEERTRALALEVEERVRTEAELRRTHESLVHAAKLAVFGRMSAAIVHEVGQSLSALENNLAASELHRREGSGAGLDAALERSRRMVLRLQGVVTRLRSFGSRQVPVELSPLAVAPVLGVAAEIVQPRARELGVMLELPAGGSQRVVADGPRLEQVLTNILLNAVEAAPLGCETPPRVWVEVAGGEIRICDSGPGIPDDKREGLLAPVVSGRVGGMGLGLYLVQSLMEQMSGQLTLQTRPEGGTVATLRLMPAEGPL